MSASNPALLLALLATLIGFGPAASQDNRDADVRKGHQLAIVVCSTCHVAAADQPTLPILHPPAPAFEAIVQRKDVSADSLRAFLRTTHFDLKSQQGMPDQQLAEFQIREVVAYLLSLRK